MEKTQALVEAGVVPRIRLAKAQETLEDAQDAAYLRRTAYGQDLTVEQADEMIATAARRLERRQKALDDAKVLVEKGGSPVGSLQPFQEDLERQQLEVNLADSRAHLVREIADMANAEEAYESRATEDPITAGAITEHFLGNGAFGTSTFVRVESAFEEHFGKSMPVSAMGETAVHRALGFDHRGRVDVAIHPDQPEGVWLLDYLKNHKIPYYAFRQAVKGKATGAHIHIGPGSTRLASGG